ncbi:MAG: peptide ABC transporter substrate-binding protein [Candidatus Cloacimonadota bacterium]|nr:MAG: peptide ABC transporter substrate-binding protein [Candidatus Cloacimonadota bacterium]
MNKRKKILEVKNLKMHFPITGGLTNGVVGHVKAVDGLNFDIYEGETLGMVGESGCGKSTTGRCLIKLYEPTEGELIFHSKRGKVDLMKLDRDAMRPYRSEIQMIFQDPYSSLNPRMTVRTIIEEPLLIHEQQMTAKEREDRILFLMEKVGLRPDQADRYPHEFSGGQRQRIGIARALTTNPSLIIADEPVSALDVSVQAQVINLMMDLQEEFNLTYLFIAHDLSVVEHISSRIAVMYLGNIAELGTSDQIYNNPTHPYTKALLSATPVADPRADKKQRVVLEGDVPSPTNKPSGCGFRTRCPIVQASCADEIPVFRTLDSERQIACPHVSE